MNELEQICLHVLDLSEECKNLPEPQRGEVDARLMEILKIVETLKE